MDLRKVKKLIELLESSSLDEIEIREGEETVRISRRREALMAAAQTATAAPVLPLSPAPAAAPRPADPPPEADGVQVTAPMVGTYYHGPSPGANPFVAVGQRVKKGDTLCIIEAMKLMNHIECETPGVVTALLVDDGQPVEYGQPLLALDTTA